MSDIINERKKVAIIGGGASGLVAAYFSALKNNEVVIFEKNEKLGKKIYITGKGRCNLTNDVEPNEFLENVVTNKKFLLSAVYKFSPSRTMEFFEKLGLSLKVERGNRVFPQSDKASDVTKTLENACKCLGVKIMLNSNVENIINDGGKFNIIVNSKKHCFDSVIICTGGRSYPLTGSTGDGYMFAKKLKHSIVATKPSLVGIETKDTFLNELQGLSLKNVKLTLKCKEKTIFSDFGEMIFTHFGVSGPIVLSCSCHLNKLNVKDCSLSIDLKPALTKETLDLRLLREFSENGGKKLSNVIRGLLTSSLVFVVLKKAGIYVDKNVSQVTVEDRNKIINVLKNFSLNIKSLRPIEEAIITSGGVSVKEVNPSTMESKLVKNLYFAGEILDVDAYTGGFNLQIAFSTAFLAGNNA